MEREIHCESCLMPIKDRGDLVTVWSFFKVRPYHEACYANALKGAAMLFMGNKPINGFSGNFTAIIAFIVAWIPFFTPLTFGITVVCMLFLLVRLYSFLVIEKKLPL